MNIQKRKFLQLVAGSGVMFGLTACGGGDDTPVAGGAGGGGGGGTGSLTITGSSNIPVSTVLTPDTGTPGVSNAALAGKLLIATAVDLNGSLLRSLVMTLNPLGTGAVPAIGVVYAVQDPDSNGNYANANLVLPSFSGQVSTPGGKFYLFGDVKSSGTVKVTALSATSIDLLLTNVSLTASTDARSSGTGTVILNGTVTLPLKGK